MCSSCHLASILWCRLYCIGVWCWLMIVVFFFKQKTAYEMRISDWSSDVCSSDLSRSGQPPRPTRMQQRSAQYSWEGAMNNKPTLSFWQIWNMCFGFLGIQFGFALQNANVSRIFQTLGANVDELAILWRSEEHTSELKALMRNS